MIAKIIFRLKGDVTGKIMILSFSDDEEDIYNGILEVITNNKSLEWCNTFQDAEIQVGELKIDLAQRSVLVNDIEVRLTNMEFEILYLLASTPGRVFTIEQIYNIVWNDEYLRDCATIMKHISSIRKKVGDSSSRQLYIQTVRGVGYRFNKNLKRSAKGR